jgi:hypothetical protein
MGDVAQAEGTCNEAIASWSKAIDILTTDSDKELRASGQVGREDGVASLKAKIQQCR